MEAGRGGAAATTWIFRGGGDGRNGILRDGPEISGRGRGYTQRMPKKAAPTAFVRAQCRTAVAASQPQPNRSVRDRQMRCDDAATTGMPAAPTTIAIA